MSLRLRSMNSFRNWRRILTRETGRVLYSFSILVICSSFSSDEIVSLFSRFKNVSSSARNQDTRKGYSINYFLHFSSREGRGL